MLDCVSGYFQQLSSSFPAAFQQLERTKEQKEKPEKRDKKKSRKGLTSSPVEAEVCVTLHTF